MQPVQVRMARAALQLSSDDLAREAGIARSALDALENGHAEPGDHTQALGLYFAAHGIELIDGDAVRATTKAAAAAVPVDELTTGNDGGQG